MHLDGRESLRKHPIPEYLVVDNRDSFVEMSVGVSGVDDILVVSGVRNRRERPSWVTLQPPVSSQTSAVDGPSFPM